MKGAGRPFATGTLVISFTIDEPTTSTTAGANVLHEEALKTIVRVPSVQRKNATSVNDYSARRSSKVPVDNVLRNGTTFRKRPRRISSIISTDYAPKKSTTSAAIVRYERALASIGLHGFRQIQEVRFMSVQPLGLVSWALFPERYRHF